MFVGRAFAAGGGEYGLNVKRLLKFYFCADSLNDALDRTIMFTAVKSGGYADGGEEFAEKILRIISVKGKLSELWRDMDRVISCMTDRDRRTLEGYAYLKGGTSAISSESAREMHRAVMKFSRRSLPFRERLEEGQKLVGAFAALLASGKG